MTENRLPDYIDHIQQAATDARSERLDRIGDEFGGRMFCHVEEVIAVQMLDEAKTLIAIGFYDAAENVVQPKVVLV